MAGYEDGAAPPGDGTGEGDALRNEQLENEHADATDRYGDDPSPRRLGGMSRRRLLLALGVAGAAGVGGAAWAVSRSGDGGPVTDLDELGSVRAPGGGSPHDLAAYEDNVRSGGPPPDGIPSIDEPVFVPVDEVDFLRDEDIVFGWVKDGRPRGYSQLILVWHEIVNETSADGPVSVTYCPLTGSVVGFRPPAGVEQFGTSGSLVNSNLLMYDRTHDSRWPQILGQAIDGPQFGEELEEFPIEWTTWQRWRDRFPDTEVLSPETGFVRRYGEDPYGSYVPLTGYYREGSGTIFPVMADDDRFDRKEVFLGAKLGEHRLAVRKRLAIEDRVVEAELGDTPVVFLYDPDLDTARAFRAEAGGDRRELEPAEAPGEYQDAASGAVWDSWGSPVSGIDQPLTRVVSYDVMWFAWAAFFPHTAVVA